MAAAYIPSWTADCSWSPISLSAYDSDILVGRDEIGELPEEALRQVGGVRRLQGRDVGAAERRAAGGGADRREGARPLGCRHIGLDDRQDALGEGPQAGALGAGLDLLELADQTRLGLREVARVRLVDATAPGRTGDLLAVDRSLPSMSEGRITPRVLATFHRARSMLRASLRIDAAVCWVVPFVPLRVSSWVRNVTRLLVSATRSSAWKSPLDGAGPTLSRLPPVTAPPVAACATAAVACPAW